MNTISKMLVASFCLLCGILQLHSQGYLVQNGVTYGGYVSGFGYQINVTDNPSGASSIFSTNTQFWLNPIGKTQPTIYTNTFGLQELTDIGVRVFLVASNDPISLQPILSQSWTELGLSSSNVFQAGVPFYVALYTGLQFAPPYPPNPPYTYLDPVFGWAELENVGGTIQLLNSALEYGGAGIYAGTQTIIQPVPEPSTFAMVALGGLLLGFRHWQGRKESLIHPKA